MLKKVVLFLLCLVCFGCTSSQNPKSKVLVTIAPYAGFVKNLTDNQVQVEVFVPSGANPHTYEPTPDQVKQFTQAKVWFSIGDPIEKKMVSFLREYDIQIVNISKDWATLDAAAHTHEEGHVHSHDEKDLHLWMNPLIVAEQLQEISLILSQQFPELDAIIKNNCEKMQKKLRNLDVETSKKLARFENQYLLVSHPALGYYCDRYHLNQLSVEIEGKDPRPQDIAALMTTLQKHPVPVVLIEPQYNKKGAILIASKLKIPYVEINPYSGNYFGMFDELTDTIVKYYDNSNS